MRTAASWRSSREPSAQSKRSCRRLSDDTVEGTLTTEAVCQVNGTNADGTCKTSPITAANVTVSYRLECANGAAIDSLRR